MDELINLELKKGYKLPLMESFYTIQGEGYHSGKAAYFLRVGGCDVGCHWCDVKESWDANIHPLISIEEIINDINNYPVSTVVITGGEPLICNLVPLTDMLRDNKLEVHLETSGVYLLKGTFDWICLSPKKIQPPLNAIKPITNELKVIINNQHDFIWAEEQIIGLNDNCKLFLQPEWSKREEVIPMIINYIKEHNRWSISLQTHKYMKIP